jgi:hypothetical protein
LEEVPMDVVEDTFDLAVPLTSAGKVKMKQNERSL